MKLAKSGPNKIQILDRQLQKKEKSHQSLGGSLKHNELCIYIAS